MCLNEKTVKRRRERERERENINDSTEEGQKTDQRQSYG